MFWIWQYSDKIFFLHLDELHTIIVYNIIVVDGEVMLKNITLSAEKELIEQARQRAARERTTLNATFRQWLRQYVKTDIKVDEYDALLQSLSYAKPGKKFTREELNER